MSGVTRRKLILRLSVVVVVAAGATPSSLVAQGQVLETSLKFYSDGGSYCFRIVPPGVEASTETQWTVMVLTGASNRENTFKYGDIRQPGKTAFDLISAGLAVQIVWVENRTEFFNRFVDGMKAGRFRARVVRIGPVKANDAVSFGRISDLKPDEFLTYANYVLK